MASLIPSNHYAASTSPLPGGTLPPQYNFLTDQYGMLPSSMTLKGNNQGLEALRAQVTSNKSNPWTQMQIANNAQQNQFGQSAAAQTTGAQNLAYSKNNNPQMSAWQGIQNNMNNINGVNNQTNSANMNLITKDRAGQVAGLKDQVGNEVNALKPQEFNISNALNERTQENTAKFTDWQEKMKGWAAQNSAKAIQNSGKK